MPGNGTIGGRGSCSVSFVVTEGGNHTKWDCVDKGMPTSFPVTVTFPDGTTHTVQVDQNRKIRIVWGGGARLKKKAKARKRR